MGMAISKLEKRAWHPYFDRMSKVLGGTKRAEVEMIFSSRVLTVNVKDFGSGMVQSSKSRPGLGLIAMRERAELLSAKLNISSVPNGGTTVSLTMPLRQEDFASDTTQDESLEEVVSRNL